MGASARRRAAKPDDKVPRATPEHFATLTTLLLAACGTVLVAASFFIDVGVVALRDLEFHRRPRWAHRPLWRFAAAPARWPLLVAGVGLAAAASPLCAAVLAAFWLAARLRRAWVRSPRHQIRLLKEAYVGLCRSDPGAPREDLLAAVIRSRHPRWDAELIARMIADHPRVEDLFAALVRLERQMSG